MLLLDPAAGEVVLDAQVSRAVRELVAETVDDGWGADDDPVRLRPRPSDEVVSVVTLPLRSVSDPV